MMREGKIPVELAPEQLADLIDAATRDGVRCKNLNFARALRAMKERTYEDESGVVE